MWLLYKLHLYTLCAHEHILIIIVLELSFRRQKKLQARVTFILFHIYLCSYSCWSSLFLLVNLICCLGSFQEIHSFSKVPVCVLGHGFLTSLPASSLKVSKGSRPSQASPSTHTTLRMHMDLQIPSHMSELCKVPSRHSFLQLFLLYFFIWPFFAPAIITASHSCKVKQPPPIIFNKGPWIKAVYFGWALNQVKQRRALQVDFARKLPGI